MGPPSPPQQQQQQRQFVGPRTTPVVHQQRPQQIYNNQQQDHRAMPGSHTTLSPGRKPWDLNLQAPRRQSGIEVVSRKPQHGGQNQLQQQQNLRHQQQQFGIQPQIQRGQTVLSHEAPLRPGFQIYNGQLIEVRATNTFNMQHMQQQQHQHQHQHQHQLQHQHQQRFQNQRHIIHQSQPQRQTDSKLFQKRPGWDSASFSVAPPPQSSSQLSVNQLSQVEKEALINEKKNQATEKLIKKSKMKATKLIWDPIILDEGI